MKTLFAKLTGFALLVLGAKLWLINAYAVNIPLWDAWRQEGVRVYSAWLNGRFTPGLLFINNNVHHIACTRLYDLVLFILDAHQWDIRTELVANALLHVGGSTAVLTIVYLRLGRLAGDIALVALGVCLVVPFAYANTLWGFQSQFYFLISLSIVTLWGLLSEAPSLSGKSAAECRRGPRSWCGRIVAFVACFTMGSGFLAAGISAALLAARAWWRGRWRSDLASLLVGAAAALLGLGLFIGTTLQSPRTGFQGSSVHSSTSDVLLSRLASRAALLLDVGATTGWPIGSGRWPVGGLLLYAPFGWWLWRQWRLRKHGEATPAAPESTFTDPDPTPDRWFFAGFGLWSLAQAASIGLLRGVPPGSRHLDVLCFGLIVNGIALGLLWREFRGGKIGPGPRAASMWLGVAGAVLWLSLSTVGLFNEGQRVWKQLLPAWQAQMPAYQASVEQFAMTDDPRCLQDHPAPFFVAPKWSKMALLLRDHGLRQSLSSTLPMPGVTVLDHHPTLFMKALHSLVAGASLCLVLGSLLLIAGFAGPWAARSRLSRPAHVPLS